ncbi:hypothetical protein [Bacteroides thetaiotaomicron]|uniref:hypothetical protein n=1 Tax=Bacteroides thetaiotaomicron TaxID=818 RepID=UPI003DA3C28A
MPDKECSLPSRRVPALISRARIIPGTPFRIVPISEKSDGLYPAGFTERLYPEIAYLNRVGGCIHALGIAVESPQPLGEDLQRKARPFTGTPKSS